MINVYREIYKVNIDSDNPDFCIPASLGLSKGDLIIFSGENSPVRFPAGNTPDKVLMTDPTSPTGWKLGNGSSGGGGGGTQTVTLINNSGATILAGTIVVIDESGGEREIRKAKKTDKTTLFITADESRTGNAVECYCIPNTICSVRCTSSAIAVGSQVAVSSSDGLAEKSTTEMTVGIALTSKSAGSIGYIKVLLNCYYGGANKNFTASTTDLTDGVSGLATDHIWYYYEGEDNENEHAIPGV